MHTLITVAVFAVIHSVILTTIFLVVSLLEIIDTYQVFIWFCFISKATSLFLILYHVQFCSLCVK